MQLKIKLLSPTAKVPTRATNGSVGFDIYAAEDAVIRRGEFVRVPCGFAIELPSFGEEWGGCLYEAQIRPRSGLTSRGIVAQFGTVDPDFRGEMCVTLANLGQIYGYQVKAGDRIAQMVISSVVIPSVAVVSSLTPTDRGEKGWGSSGR